MNHQCEHCGAICNRLYKVDNKHHIVFLKPKQGKRVCYLCTINDSQQERIARHVVRALHEIVAIEPADLVRGRIPYRHGGYR